MRLPTVDDIERRIPRPEDFHGAGRGPRTASRVGSALGIAFGICFLTGVWSHLQYDPPSWAPIGPSPTQLYRVTQGLHVISGTAAIPLLLVKLWSVYPCFFERPPLGSARSLVLHGLERISIAVLVGGSLFMLVSGTLNIVQWYPWEFSFRKAHEAVAWVTIGALLIHIAVKLPVIRDAFTTPSESSDDDVERRTVLRAAGLASGAAVLLTAGQTVPILRDVSVFGPRDGDGPQDLPVNRTAKAAGAVAEAMSADFALEIVAGDRVVRLTRAEMGDLRMRTHTLPIACVEGWSRSAEWTGVAVRDLVALVGAPPDSAVRVESMQTRGAFGRSELPREFVADPRTLLALQLNGEPLALDHGYPCRIIAPNRPGVLQTKWVRRLEVLT